MSRRQSLWPRPKPRELRSDICNRTEHFELYPILITYIPPVFTLYFVCNTIFVFFYIYATSVEQEIWGIVEEILKVVNSIFIALACVEVIA